MNNDLMMAVLSMNAYAVPGDDSIGQGQAVGLAAELPLQLVEGAFAAYAHSYGGKAVISYRGTDGAYIGDIVTGWPTGAGFSSSQLEQAAEFYQTVAGSLNPPYGVSLNGIVLTGHSLGGGLAGAIAGLHGHKAVMFDNMAFRMATNWIYEQATTPTVTVPTNIVPSGQITNPNHQWALDTYYSPLPPTAPNFSNISGYRLEGQALNFPGGFQSEGQLVGAGVDWGDFEGPVDSHSMALLVLNMYAEQKGLLTTDAKQMTQYVGSALLSGNTVTNIAYSVVDEGHMPKGNVAVRDLFDDMADVGKLIAAKKNMAVGGGLKLSDAANDNVNQKRAAA